MADATETPGQEPSNSDNGGGASSRSLDAFPEDAQDYIRRLRQEAASYRNDLKSVNSKLKEFEDAGKSEQERLNQRAAAAEAEVQKAGTKLIRYEVAAEKGLPLNLAGRLQGSTKEELEADAEALKKQFGLDGEPEKGDTGGSGFDGGVRRPVTKPKGMNDIIRQQAFRR